jgi:thymidylate synthase ThyX
MNRVFDIYCALVASVRAKLEGIKPLTEAAYKIHEGGSEVKIGELTDEKDIKAFRRTYDTDLNTKACDTVRILLPAATLTNVGIFANGRAYQHMLNRLYSSEMPEFHELAKSSHAELDKLIKRYVQRAGRSEFIANTNREMQSIVDTLLHGIEPRSAPDVTLLDDETRGFARAVLSYATDEDLTEKDLAAFKRLEFTYNTVATMLYKYAEHPMEQLRDLVREMTPEQIGAVIHAYTGERKTKRDRSGRALEYGYPLTYDLCCDFGIFRDLHRHRMLTMERQRLSTRNGFCDIPPILAEVGADGVRECQDISADLYEKARAECGRDIAQYPVLFGFNIRFFQGMNARELQHLAELRTIKQGHPSYRKVAQKMRTFALERYPWLGKATQFTDYNDYFWSRAESEARQRQKEAELDKKERQEG